ncbi:histidine kinase [Flavobacterium agricola]|uniref:Histidine kinase n=1 Tax=Flavobacterium agricola TaxID=2870839 RepID=A0ABY6LVJ2_9FLAO|nr:sensor histidine kinase [Flavobacterium agricola]UYW00349.1 histidine kinase [Flavobacterium agricola]
MKDFRKHIKRYVFTLLFAYLLVLGLNFYFASPSEPVSYANTFFAVFMYTTSIYIANSFFVYLFFKQTKLLNENLKYAFGYWVAILSALFVAMLIDFFITFLWHNQPVYESFIALKRKQMFPQYVLVFFITTVVYFFLVYKKKQETQVRAQKIIAQSATAKFASLKSQIDPHFLFNSLNVLSCLIEENPNKAQQFTIALSKTYRYVLEQRNNDLVDLQDELHFAKTFVQLLKMRYEDALEISLPEIDTETERKVVPLVLQLLLENAVKHNKINAQHPLKILITIDDNFLRVENNYQPKETLKNNSTGFGLNHIVERYQLVTSRELVIKQTPNSYQVLISILTEHVITEVNENDLDAVDAEVLARAQSRLFELKSFYLSLFFFLFLVLIYCVLNALNIFNPILFWMPFVLFIFGLSIIIQYFQIFKMKKWEQKMIAKYLQQNKKHTNHGK